MTSRPARFARGVATPNRVIECGREAQRVNRLHAMSYPYAREMTCQLMKQRRTMRVENLGSRFDIAIFDLLAMEFLLVLVIR